MLGETEFSLQNKAFQPANTEIHKNCKKLTWYWDVETKVSYGSFKVITPPTPRSFKRLTSAGNGTAPNSTNWKRVQIKNRHTRSTTKKKKKIHIQGAYHTNNTAILRTVKYVNITNSLEKMIKQNKLSGKGDIIRSYYVANIYLTYTLRSPRTLNLVVRKGIQNPTCFIKL